MTQPLYTSKTELVTSMLRELIVTGELESGAPLRQRDLAARLNVSATPVREALRRLESEGLVHADLHRGATVADSALDATEENYLIRAALESLAAELAAKRITEDQLAEIERINAKIKALADSDPGYGPLNRDFHFGVYQSAGSPVLVSLMRMLWHAMPEGPKVVRSHRESAAEHAAIIAALRAGDGGRASELTNAHIAGSRHLAEERPVGRKDREHTA
ncbi:MAG: GntR family transcriptional regulator [Sciscionella sp.]